MNHLIGQKVAIVSDKPQTTRNRIQCVLTREDYQLIFIDTPGIHKPKNRLGEYMVKAAQSTLNEVDVIVFVVDAAAGVGAGDRYIMNMLKETDTPVVATFNKIDKTDHSRLYKIIDEFQKSGEYADIIMISALEGINLKQLEQRLESFLEEGPQYYPEDMITDQP